MPALIQCPTCSKEYRWKPELAGKRVKCKCGTVISVPTAEPATEANDTYDLADNGPSYQHGLADLQAAAAAAPVAVDEGNQFRCPYCGESIEPGSSMCVFCGSALAPGSTPAAKRLPPTAMQAAPPVANRPVKMRAPTADEQSGKTKLIVIGVVAVLLVVGAVFGLKNFAPKHAAQDPNLQPGDAAILSKIDDQSGKEARDWLKADNHNLMGLSKKQANYKVDELYQLGAKQVIAFSAGISTTIAVELPEDPAKRKDLFDWQLRWHKEYAPDKVETDHGQKWFEIQMHV